MCVCVCVCVHSLYAYTCACTKVFDVCKYIPYMYACVYACKSKGGLHFILNRVNIFMQPAKKKKKKKKKESASRREENLATFASTSSFHECTKIVLSIMYLCFNL